MGSLRASPPRPSLRSIAGALAAFALASASAGNPAVASPLSDGTEGDAVFTGVTTPHATSTFLNPAALGWAGQGWHFYLGSSMRLDQLSVDRVALDPDGGPPSDGPSASLLTPTPGGFIAAIGKLGDRAHVGVTLHTPFAERFPSGGDALGYHSLGGYLYSTHLSAGGAFRVDRFFFGFSLSLNYSFARWSFLRDTAIEGGSAGVDGDCGGERCGFENPDATERITIKSDDYATGGFLELQPILGLFSSTSKLGLSAGIAMEIPNLEQWWLTLAYVGPPGVVSAVTATEGTAEIERAPRDGGGTVKGEAEIIYRVPQSVTLAARGPLLPGWTMISSLRWDDTSRHRELDVRFRGTALEAVVPEWYPRARGFRDTFQAQVGLEMDEGRAFRFGGRARIESGASRSSTVSPLADDTHNLGLAGGIEWRLGQHVALAAGYDVTAFLPVDRDSSAFDPNGRVKCVDSGFDYESCEAVRDGRAWPSAAGSYQRLRHQFVLGLRWDSL